MGRSEQSVSRSAVSPRRVVLLGALGTAATLALGRPASAGPLARAAYPLVTRAAWGADESLRFTAGGTEIWPPEYYPLQTLSLHHTADGSSNPDPAARVRAIYRNDAVGKGYGDLGYHYLIDANGRVYEGRWSGTDGTPAHDAAGRLVTAAHIGSYNSGNLGIALLGTFTDTPVSAAARASLVQLLAELAARHSVDPLATVVYRNPVSGVTRTVAAISGHRDWAATQCPGTLHADLPQLRRDVDQLTVG
ncbi:N-acetylmuramoyl-L-alanine amidase [Streptomyces roseirectus]|uniref:N-acetylmuramoyl-L-alanine amidase n=1 Tax=Streptomyces roseirectus TaxID=2768066 RepID=A0A7H0I882_9ACTN|nr:peptidoglycan recognition family protein [Streptomyces roseirectus]QNP68998.1 N-acetylmuramoyl-L-alanine amidase [Streptomyces roseirectus]